MARRGTGESRIFFPWERPRARISWLSRRNLGTALLLGLGALGVYVLVRVEARRTAVHVTRAAISDTRRAYEAFLADHEGRCPTSVTELVQPSDGHEPYLARAPRDGWGRPLRVVCPGRKDPQGVDVISGGPSGTFEDLDQMD